MRRIDLLGLAVARGEPQHGAGNLVLGVRRQTAQSFEGTFKELGHGQRICTFLRDVTTAKNSL